MRADLPVLYTSTVTVAGEICYKLLTAPATLDYS
jgi:hypothetical protein